MQVLLTAQAARRRGAVRGVLPGLWQHAVVPVDVVRVVTRLALLDILLDRRQRLVLQRTSSVSGSFQGMAATSSVRQRPKGQASARQAQPLQGSGDAHRGYLHLCAGLRGNLANK